MTASKTVTATFSTTTSTSYTITASAGTGGAISPSGSVSVSSGSSKTFTITPSSGYKIADVKVDGSSVGALSSYTFSNVTANRTISASFTATASTVTVYEDAEDKTTQGWDIYDNDPSGATISNVYDRGRASRVIKLSGSGTKNGYRLRNSDSSSWGNTSQFVAEWSMKYSREYTIHLDVETSAGHRYLTYQPSLPSSSSTGEYVYYSLGSSSKDGKWHTYTRDLQADLSNKQPGVTILKVNGFIIRGSGKVDDIKLKNN
ncbi:MAG: hypothetical protein K8I29_18580 [Alphaproteobacteria bacterium]|uniref:Uncharacterized protein n=1 Tax=Candidatus Nitrobium versatile TaxID=2884831 RepID=A0A953M3D6_9BACT|nr:hypothetical protein [Candidatus Nitrobium versatile]